MLEKEAKLFWQVSRMVRLNKEKASASMVRMHKRKITDPRIRVRFDQLERQLEAA